MKKAFKGTYLVIVILILVSMMCLIACGETDDTTPDTGNQDGGDNGTTIKPIIYTLVLKASSTEVTRGDKITLNAIIINAASINCPRIYPENTWSASPNTQLILSFVLLLRSAFEILDT